MTDLVQLFRATLTAAETNVVSDVHEYVAWQIGRQDNEFAFTEDDDVDLRSYLLHQRVHGLRRSRLQRKLRSLKRFYRWAEEEELIEYNPFNDVDFNRPLLDAEAIARRKQTLPDDPYEGELARLQALNELAQELNQAVDVERTLEVTLAKVVEVMDVPTAWIFLLPEVQVRRKWPRARPAHDFALATFCGLPPGLEERERYFLCQPPDCHCQSLLRRGRLTRAVNIVECTRCQDASKAGGDNRGLMFHASAPLIASGRVLGLINVATEEWQFFTAADLRFLSTVSAQVAVALDRARLFDLAQSQRAFLERELKMAHEVQANLMPDPVPEILGYELASFWQAAREMAGDFYDVFSLADGRWALVIADVCDKGAPAAMYMAMTRTLLRTYAGRRESPADVLKVVNGSIQEHSTSNMFVTVFYGILDPGTGTLTYASGGHEPPLLCRAGGTISPLMPTGPLLGIFDEVTISKEEVTLAPGDRFVGYTDGVKDAVNGEVEEYGSRRLKRAIDEAHGTADATLNRILEELAAFAGDTGQSDDVTVLIVRRELA